MAKLSLRPLDDRVVVEPQEAEERTAGGIVPRAMPETTAVDIELPDISKYCPLTEFPL